MTDDFSSAGDSFLLVTLDGFSLRLRPVGGTHWHDARLGEKCCALLAFLATMATPVPRPLLCELLWQGADGGKARNSLRQALFRIRRILGERSILETSQGVRLAPRVIAIDVARTLDGAADGSVASQLGPSLADAFGHTSRPIGSAFDDWRNGVRDQLRRGEFRMGFRSADGDGHAAGAGRVSEVPADVPALQRLAQLYRLSSHGIPVTVWVTGRPESELRRAVDSFASECRLQGACVAVVTRRPGAGYARYALERDLSEAIWPIPGAAGVKPEHRGVLDRAANGHPVDHDLLRNALLDLIAAVAENAPLVITLGNPGRYSVGALTSFVSELAALRDRAVMLVVAEHSGMSPVNALCIEVPLLGSPTGDATRLPEGERRGANVPGKRPLQ